MPDLDPKTLPADAVVECVGGVHPHYPDETCHNIARVFVPVPDGVTVMDYAKAVGDARPWVHVGYNRSDVPEGARWRHVFGGVGSREGGIDEGYTVHPDDVPDPDADIHSAIDNALPNGSWTPEEVLANLRANGFDIVKQENAR